MNRLLYAWTLGAILSALPVVATQSAFSARVWQTDEGLPNNTVTDVAQTADGYLWLATPSRLARFDGVHFESYTAAQLGAQLQQTVTTLLTDRAGALWLGLAPGGLIRFHNGAVQRFTNGVPDLFPQSLTEDGEGAIWITFNLGTLCRVKDGQVRQFTDADGWPKASVASVACDRKGRLWFAKAGQAGWFVEDHFQMLHRLPRPVGRVTAARDGRVWLASGVQIFRISEGGELREIAVLPVMVADAEPTAVLEDAVGALWIGTKALGLFRCADGKVERVAVSHRQIECLAEDREGNVWVGTAGGGLNRVRRRAIEFHTTATGLPFESVRSLAEDTNGVVWAVTGNGLLIRQQTNGWEVVRTNAGWPGELASCVAADAKGAVWIGTEYRAINCWREGRFTSVKQDVGLLGRQTQGVLAARNGDLWFGQTVADALLRYRNGVLTTSALPSNVRVIQAMAEDAGGNVWLGTTRGRLLRAAGDEVVDETSRTMNVHSDIRCLCATDDGSLWIGYGGQGLGRLKNGRFAVLDSGAGLLDDSISQIVPDDHGWFWFGSEHGVFKVRRAELEAVAEGRASRVRSIRYGGDEGLHSLQASFGRSPGAMRSHDGRVWLPMRTGLVVIDPAQLAEPSEALPLLIRRVSLDDKPVAEYGGVLPVNSVRPLGPGALTLAELPPAHRRIEFEFAAPTFVAPQNVFFRYRLEGFDESWVEAGAERRASYSRLVAGRYRFVVQACNVSGVWSPAGAAVAFTVRPFFWQTWWFQLAVVAVFTAGVAGVVRYVSHRRLRAKLRAAEQQAALERERSRIARDIHDDLGNRLTKITLLSGLAMRTNGNGQTTEHVGEIGVTVQEATDALDEIVWAINPRNDTLPHLVNYLGQFAVEFLRAAGIRCRADLPDHPPDDPVTAEVRHNLFLTVKEALNNIVRHAGATEVQLRFHTDNGAAVLTLEDNGRGFAGESPGEGSDGLRNMRQRMAEIGGEIEIASSPGKGTKVCLKVPWPVKK